MNELIKGDCMKELLSIKGIADCVITDPPYGIDYQSSRSSDKKPKIKNDSRPFVWWLPLAFEALKTTGCLVCFCRWDVQEAFRQAIEWSGFSVKSQLVWNRGNHGLGDLEATPAPMHDVAWFATKGKYKLPGKRPTTIFNCMRISGESLRHPTEKPEGLMCDLVEAFCPPGGLVLDPFAGSGSTLVAAQRMHREWIGIEIEEKYIQIARGRLDSVQPSLFGAN